MNDNTIAVYNSLTSILSNSSDTVFFDPESKRFKGRDWKRFSFNKIDEALQNIYFSSISMLSNKAWEKLKIDLKEAPPVPNKSWFSFIMGYIPGFQFGINAETKICCSLDLHANHASATFYLIGEHAEIPPKQIREMTLYLRSCLAGSLLEYYNQKCVVTPLDEPRDNAMVLKMKHMVYRTNSFTDFRHIVDNVWDLKNENLLQSYTGKPLYQDGNIIFFNTFVKPSFRNICVPLLFSIQKGSPFDHILLYFYTNKWNEVNLKNYNLDTCSNIINKAALRVAFYRKMKMQIEEWRNKNPQWIFLNSEESGCSLPVSTTNVIYYNCNYQRIRDHRVSINTPYFAHSDIELGDDLEGVLKTLDLCDRFGKMIKEERWPLELQPSGSWVYSFYHPFKKNVSSITFKMCRNALHGPDIMMLDIGRGRLPEAPKVSYDPETIYSYLKVYENLILANSVEFANKIISSEEVISKSEAEQLFLKWVDNHQRALEYPNIITLVESIKHEIGSYIRQDKNKNVWLKALRDTIDITDPEAIVAYQKRKEVIELKHTLGQANGLKHLEGDLDISREKEEYRLAKQAMGHDVNKLADIKAKYYTAIMAALTRAKERYIKAIEHSLAQHLDQAKEETIEASKDIFLAKRGLGVWKDGKFENITEKGVLVLLHAFGYIKLS